MWIFKVVGPTNRLWTPCTSKVSQLENIGRFTNKAIQHKQTKLYNRCSTMRQLFDISRDSGKASDWPDRDSTAETVTQTWHNLFTLISARQSAAIEYEYWWLNHVGPHPIIRSRAQIEPLCARRSPNRNMMPLPASNLTFPPELICVWL